MMKPFVFLFLLVHGVSAVTHSLKYFYTGSSGIQNFPEFVTVGMVDDLQIDHYDSKTGRAQIKEDWMTKVLENDPQYLDSITQIYMGSQPTFKAGVEILRQRFNQTKGVHVVQRMVGCEWDDETGEVKGYDQYGYDGEDFISLNLKEEQFIAPKPEAVITKHKWDNRAEIAARKNYLTQICPEWLKKYVNYGRSSLMRKDVPSVSLLQKTPSSPVSCHATGFYPDRAMMFWRKDGEEIHEGVEQGEILPNHDGSFQMNVDLDISSVSPADWRRYNCVFQLSGVEDIIIKLDKASIKTNWGKSDDGGFPPGAVAGIVVGLLLLAAIIAGIIIWKRNNNGFKRANTSDTSSASSSGERVDADNKPVV